MKRRAGCVAVAFNVMRSGNFAMRKRRTSPPKSSQFGYGDVWRWIALDADTKLVPSWLVSTRDAVAAYTFMMDVASRLKNKVQLTTDGHKPYLSAVEDAFGADIDYATLQKLYGSDPDETRYTHRES